jgi:hypothetical protein
MWAWEADAVRLQLPDPRCLHTNDLREYENQLFAGGQQPVPLLARMPLSWTGQKKLQPGRARALSTGA